jgi:hypothetical protein
MIEPCWAWMKRQTTKRGVASSIAQMKKDWEECWKRLFQERIQAWIERIMRHIQKVILLKGGNEYKEGREDEVEGGPIIVDGQRQRKRRNPNRVR